MGNAVVTVFGYHPIRARFTPSYASKFYDLRPSKQQLLSGRYFDETAAFYDMKKRNERVFSGRRIDDRNKVGGTLREQIAERRRKSAISGKMQEVIAKALYGFASDRKPATYSLWYSARIMTT